MLYIRTYNIMCVCSLNVLYLQHVDCLVRMCELCIWFGYQKYCLQPPSPQVSMLESVPGVIHTIRMIHAVSRRYNTSERMTSLFVKVCTYVCTYAYICAGGTNLVEIIAYLGVDNKVSLVLHFYVTK